METKTYTPKKTYTLIQQSPIIHFQSYEKGATLRASEVKPKLDKFIIGRLEKGILDKHKNWLAGDGKHPALNYKMRFFPDGEQKTEPPHKIYYGNMKNPEPSLCVTGNCKMEIVCFIPELMEIINKNIENFFICTNFGRMQSKGFGSYIVEGTNTNNVAEILTKNFDATICYKINGYKKTYQMFNDIKKMYSVMKSGYNGLDYTSKDKYHRSYLFEYCHDKLGIGNEKAELKRQKISPWANVNGEYCPVRHPDNSRNNNWNWDKDKVSDNHPPRYVRAMLGVGEHISYIKGFNNDNTANGREPISISSEEIKRFASPIKFKIIGNTIYIFATKIPNDMFDKKFTFTNENKKKRENDIKKNNPNHKKQTYDCTLSTPEKFNAEEFLIYFVEEYKSAKGNGTYGLNEEIAVAYQTVKKGEDNK